MMKSLRFLRGSVLSVLCLGILQLGILACDSGNGFTVGGTVSGLSGTVVLQDDGGDNLSVSSNSDFTFATALANGDSYAVTVLTQPSGQTCTVANGSGTINGQNVTNVSVTCASNAPTTFTVGGSVSGLYSGYELQLSNNSGDALTVQGTSDGFATFTFSTGLTDGSTYDVAVVTAPQDCQVTNGSGTVSNSNVDSIVVSCAHRFMFLSTSTHDGDLRGIATSGTAGADAICAADPQCPVGSTCQAMLASAEVGHERTACTTANCGGGSSEHVDWVLAPSAAYLRLDGATVVGITNANAIFDFNLSHGLVDSTQQAWTGLSTDWTTHFYKCFSWTSTGSSGQGEVGDAAAVDSTFIDLFNFTSEPLCTTTQHLICVTTGGIE